MGIKVLSIPIFIIAFTSFLGFRNKGFSETKVGISKQSFIPESAGKSKNAQPDSINNVTKAFLPDSTNKNKNTLLSDLAKTKISKADSIRFKAKEDSLKRIETLSKDSTARLKHFHFHRDDPPYVQFRQKKPSSFFARPFEGTISRTVQLDSTGEKVTIKENIGGKPYRTYLEMPLDEFIKLRLEAVTRDIWEQKAYEYKLKEGKRDLTQLITDITNIDIPLPSSPILSIFGPPKINLKISGQVNIYGAWRNTTTTGITTSALGNTRNEPDFKQQVQVNLSGTIGDKLTLGADWNTERQFQFENQLKLRYTGYEDEIIQSIEAGNVALQTSPLVGGSDALFGVKALFKMGPFSLTALASQKKSEVQEVTVSGGAKSQKFEIRAYDYSPNHFFIHEIYTDPRLNIFNNYYNNPVAIVVDSLRVRDIQVWKTITGLPTSTERKANAYIDLPKRKRGELYNSNLRDTASVTNPTIPGVQEINRRFTLLVNGVDYTYNPYTGVVSFKTQIQDQDAIAVAFVREGPTTAQEDDIYYGEFIDDLQGTNLTRLVLKLVKPPTLQPQFKKAWKLQLKNIYPVGGRQIKEEGFSLDINYRIEGQEAQNNYQGVRLLQAFSLDKTDKSGTSTQADGNFDYFPPRTIMPETGEIIFPVLQPFGKDFPKSLPDSLNYQAIYDTTVTYAKQDRSKDKFVISGEYSASITSVYNIGFNVVDNSVKVYLDGNLLKSGTDYTVDYNLGQIQIRREDALVPGKNLRITYEQNDLFQLASKTLLGFRGIYEFNKETALGFSFLNLSQQTLSDKVRIGEEPLKNSIYGIDFRTNINLPFVTEALDNIISTSAPSNFSMNAEYAYISPDPNTKKSTIASDNGKSIAYIDDFEGAKKVIPLGMAYGSWRDISVPDDLPFIGKLPLMDPELKTDAQMNYKAKAYWYNINPSDLTVNVLYGNRKKAAPNSSQIQVLDFVFQPDKKGFFNWNPTLGDKSKNWGGFMKVLSSTANNLVEENMQFIEFWLYIREAPADLKINIDLGRISEDVIPNGNLDTEDKGYPNRLLDVGEDVGLDGLQDTEEPGYNAQTNPDPSADNYSYQTGSADYSSVNATEGNGKALDLGKLPDTEDLNGNFTLDNTNSYFRYEVPIDTNRSVNKFIQAGGAGNGGWYLYRIPLKDFVSKIGNPSFSVVEFIRFWVSGANQQVRLRFTEMNLVGNQWQKVLTPKVTVSDTILTLSTINVEDNAEYSPPLGLQRERDRTQPNYEIFKNEQSLNLILKKLEDGDKREVVRYLYKPFDLFNYNEMKLFVHSDDNELPGSVSYYQGPNNYASEVYLKFGSDTLNYYEYRQPVRANPDKDQKNWSEISIRFNELTAIKEGRDSSDIKSLYRVNVEGKEGHTYGVKGNPTLTRVTFFMIGIENPRDKGTPNEPVSGNVWVNELRVLEANTTPGWTYRASAALQLADLVKVNFNIGKTNPYFRRLNERFGSREDLIDWGLAVDLDLLKLIPANLAGSNLRLTYSRTEKQINPLYKPGTDVKISDAQNELRRFLTEKNFNQSTINRAVDSLKQIAQTINVSETWTLSNVRIKIPTDIWYIRDTFNNLNFLFNYNRTNGTSPTIVSDESWLWNAGANYSVSLSRDLYFKPLDIPIIGSFFDLFSDYRDVKIFFAPQSISLTLAARRTRRFTQPRAITTSIKSNVSRDFTATRGAGFNWSLTEGGLLNLSLGYSFDVSSTYNYLLTENNDVERSESDIWRDIFGGNLFGRDNNYKQSVDLRANPKIPSIWDLNRFITLNASYSVSYQWQNNFTQENLGRSAGYINRITSGVTIRVKSIFAPLFTEEEKPAFQQQRFQQEGEKTGGRRSGRGSQRTNEQQQIKRPVLDEDVIAARDSTKLKKDAALYADEDSVKTPGKLEITLEYLKLGVKYLLFDYDNVSINFSQSSSYSGDGLAGTGTGFNNFWGYTQSYNKGPNRLFMLGLSNDLGPRAPKGNLQDNYSQKNDIDFKTSRPLWEGAQLDLTWKVGWGINKTAALRSDSLGNVTIANILSTGTIDRSFLSLPPTFFFSFFGNGIKKVSELYDKSSANPNESLSEAFLKGFETFSIFSKIPILSKVMKYIPRPNWTFTWSGLERYEIFSFAKRVTINHAYVSSYSEGWRINPYGLREVQTQRIEYAFSPLMGISMNFEQFLGGSFQGNIRYTTKTAYSVGVSAKNITEAFSRDISVSASYTKTGFELPLFGVSLKNDLEISFTYTSGKTSSIIFEMDQFKESGIQQGGKTNTIIEPKIKYVMSSRVTLSIFYRRTSIEPVGAERISPTTTNEAGVDVRITIQ